MCSAYLLSTRTDAWKEVDFQEDAFGAIMMIKRLESTNPSVIINRMDDNLARLAIYHKTSDAQPISFV
jgi:hypothetical protein